MVGMTRLAAVAGQFYPGTATQLTHQLKECFLDARGCGQIPSLGSPTKHVKGVIVPHAGYIYSGAIASHSYCAIAEDGFADTFLILGPNHTGSGSGVAVMTEGSWQTPLGNIPINSELALALHTGIIDADQTAHLYEHSIEVQLPFLQFLANNRSFDFVPLCMMMQDLQTAQEVGMILVQAIKHSKKKVVIIASTDFSHAGFNYRSMPPEGMRVDEYAKTQDHFALDKIVNLDPAGLINTVEEKQITMCGYGPVASMLVAAQALGATKAELLKYGTSYEVQPSTSCVGYGSLVVY